MKQWSREEIMKGLKNMVDDNDEILKGYAAKFTPSEDFDGKKGGIMTFGSEVVCIYKEIPAFNHDLDYGEMLVSEATLHIIPDHSGMKVKEMYIYGIHREIYSWLEERGWYPEWHDRVTLFFWKCTEDSKDEINKNLKNYQIFLDTHEIDGIEGEILKKLKERFKEEK